MAETIEIELESSISIDVEIVLENSLIGPGSGVSFSGVKDSVISGNTTTFVDIVL
jgi:hypothetical protein